MFAEALAAELRIGFLSVSFADLNSMWIGQTSERVSEIFRDARAQAPCLLFVDEIDSLLVDRGTVVNGDSERLQITNIILTGLVDLRGSGVVVVAATNFIDKLDGAGGVRAVSTSRSRFPALTSRRAWRFWSRELSATRSNC